MTLEDIGEGDDALLCVTDLTACCRSPYTDPMGPRATGNWYFPNGTRVLSSGAPLDFHRTRGQSVVTLHRKRGGVRGIYSCVIPDAMNKTQIIYIGVYTAEAGEWYTCIYTSVLSNYTDSHVTVDVIMQSSIPTGVSVPFLHRKLPTLLLCGY